jgi:hypothetical protein
LPNYIPQIFKILLNITLQPVKFLFFKEATVHNISGSVIGMVIISGKPSGNWFLKI